MAYLLDLIFIGLAVALIVLAAKKGFIEALLDGFSAIIAGLFAYWFAEPASQFAYNSFVSDKIEDFNSSFYYDAPQNILNAFLNGKIGDNE